MTCYPGTVAIMNTGRLPPWREIQADIRRRIAAGEWVPGGPLPSLAELSAEYHVSPTTVRKALESLKATGEVESVRGWRYFVAGPGQAGG